MDNSVNDPEFLNAFESLTLPHDQWTHRAHVKAAYLYLRDHSFEDAVAIMRERIKAFNAHNHVPDGPTQGYNETTTVAFMHLVAATMAAYGSALSTHDADAFCDAHPQLMTRHALRLFYSPQQRMHPDAKHRFVEPDLTPLPRIIANGQ